MANNSGWIKLHRIMTDHWVHDDPFMYRAWCDLLLLANHKDSKVLFCGETITVKKGQRITSIKKLSLLWNCSPKTAKRVLNLFENDGMIKTQNLKNRGTLISIVNYCVYQQESDAKGKTNYPTDYPTEEPTTYPTEYLQTRMNKNELKNEKEKDANFSPFDVRRGPVVYED